MAVIELSVGAGLVTILFVFAITLAGDEAMTVPALVPHRLSGLLVVSLIIVLGWLMQSPAHTAGIETATMPFTIVLWETRGLDVLVQIGLIFAGVMGILGLLAEERTVVRTPQTHSVISPLDTKQPLTALAKKKTEWTQSYHKMNPLRITIEIFQRIVYVLTNQLFSRK